MSKRCSSVVLVCVWYAAWSAPALAQTGAAPGIAAQIETAAADSLYAIEIALTPPASIGELRTVAAGLGVPRVFATVNYSIEITPVHPSFLVLNLGSLFDDKAAGRHSECKALLQLNSTQNSLRNVPIDEWPVSRMSVSATAHAVRELLRSTTSVATIVSGSAAPSKSMASEPMANPNDIELPPYCVEFVVPLNEPYLTGGLPRELQSLAP